MNILAVETATEACSAAVWADGTLLERYEVAPRRHGELILPMVDSLLSESGLSLQDINALAFGAGPGAFTGVRIAASLVQGLAVGADLPVVPVSSLAALAQAATMASGRSRVAAVLDARMGEVYFGLFRRDEDGLVAAEGEELVCAPQDVPQLTLEDGCSAGSGWTAHGDVLGMRILWSGDAPAMPEFPRAGDVARLAVREVAAGRAVTAEEAIPHYVRDTVTHQKR